MKKVLIAALLCATASAGAKNVPLPDYVTVKAGVSRSGDYVDTVNFQLPPTTFSKLKLCMAQNIRNPTVALTGGTDAPFTFYSSNKTQTTPIQGGEVFKYEDASASTVIAAGVVEAGIEVFSRKFVRFEVTATADSEKTALRFANIEQATENTGAVTNYGFIPVGAWKGAKPMRAVEAVKGVSDQVGRCLN